MTAMQALIKALAHQAASAHLQSQRQAAAANDAARTNPVQLPTGRKAG